MTDGCQKLSQAIRIAVVGAVVRALACVAMQAQWLQIFDKICAAMLNGDNVIKGERASSTAAQANTVKPIAHRKPITPMERLTAHFRATLVLIHPRRNTVLISVRRSPSARKIVNTLLIVLIPMLSGFSFAIRVRQSPLARLLELMCASIYIRTLLDLSKMIRVVSSFLARLLIDFVSIQMIPLMLFCIQFVTMVSTVLGFCSQTLISIAQPLITSYLNIIRIVFTRVMSFLLLCTNCIMVFGIALLMQGRKTRLAFGTVLTTIRAKKEIIQGLKGVTQTAYLAVEEGQLYTFHVNLHKRLAVPAGVSAPRGLFVCLNYSIFATFDQGFSALGGPTCLWG